MTSGRNLCTVYTRTVARIVVHVQWPVRVYVGERRGKEKGFFCLFLHVQQLKQLQANCTFRFSFLNQFWRRLLELILVRCGCSVVCTRMLYACLSEYVTFRLNLKSWKLAKYLTSFYGLIFKRPRERAGGVEVYLLYIVFFSHPGFYLFFPLATSAQVFYSTLVVWYIISRPDINHFHYVSYQE